MFNQVFSLTNQHNMKQINMPKICGNYESYVEITFLENICLQNIVE